MITIKNETIDSIPILNVGKDHLDEKPIPTIFFLHGYTSAKEHNLHVAYLLAEKGFRVILPDALHHGMREQGLIGKERDLSFWKIILTSIKEIDQLKTTLENRELIDGERIGVIGTSMGAITMYGALATYEWIKTAVSFMGTAYYERFAAAQLKMLKEQGVQLEEKIKKELFEQIKPYDLSSQLEKIEERPLLIWHGKEDRVVPYSFSQNLYHDLNSYYANRPDHLKFISEEKVSHKVSRPAVLQSVDWFEHHLLTHTLPMVK